MPMTPQTLLETTNALRLAVQRARPDEGVQLFETILHPSGEHHYWAGVCWLNLHQLEAAKRAFHVALDLGFNGAISMLATALRLEGDVEAAAVLLDGLEIERLEPFHRAVAWRELGATRWELDDLEGSLVPLEHAWQTALDTEHGELLLPMIGDFLSRSHFGIGEHARALEVASAALNLTNARVRPFLLYRIVLCRIELGQLERAEADCADLETFVPDEPRARDLCAYARAFVLRKRGRYFEARYDFRELLATASGDVPFHALLNLAEIELEDGTNPWAAHAWVRVANKHTMGRDSVALRRLRLVEERLERIPRVDPRRLSGAALEQALYTAHWNQGSRPEAFGELERAWIRRAEEERARRIERRPGR
jgi:tetratricopeptide (TPR) repeat protein